MDDGAPALDAIWDATLRELRADPEMGNQQQGFVTMTRPIRVLDDLIILAAPNEFTRDIISHRLEQHVLRAFEAVLQREVRLAVIVDPNAAPPIDEETADGIADGTYATISTPVPGDATTSVAGNGSALGRGQLPGDLSEDKARGLNPKYTFETFVTGSSNRFANAAAVAVAEQPARAYNPLFIYGDSGLGKTHLLHAIGHYNRTLYPSARVRYISSEEFTNDFINSIQENRNSLFQGRYRNVDVLLVDDIQFLGGKVQTQEEFFHTFNTLHNANKQIVITSDVPPKQLPGLEDRLRSRFEWGLTTDIQPPDLETRIAILRKKKQIENFEVPEAALEYIASRIDSNIRELEGALIRVKAFASLNQQPVDLSITKHVIDGLLPDSTGPEITSEAIMERTATYFGVTLDDLTGPSRTRTLVNARQVAMYLCRELTQLSLPRIGQIFGGRDHTTVMHADRKIRDQMQERRTVYNQVHELTNIIKSDPRR